MECGNNAKNCVAVAFAIAVGSLLFEASAAAEGAAVCEGGRFRIEFGGGRGDG